MSNQNQPADKKITVRAEVGKAIDILTPENLTNPNIELLTPSEITMNNVLQASDDFNELIVKVNPFDEGFIFKEIDGSYVIKAYRFFANYCFQIANCYESNKVPELGQLYTQTAQEFNQFATQIEAQIEALTKAETKKAPPPPKKA